MCLRRAILLRLVSLILGTCSDSWTHLIVAGVIEFSISKFLFCLNTMVVEVTTVWKLTELRNRIISE